MSRVSINLLLFIILCNLPCFARFVTKIISMEYAIYKYLWGRVKEAYVGLDVSECEANEFIHVHTLLICACAAGYITPLAQFILFPFKWTNQFYGRLAQPMFIQTKILGIHVILQTAKLIRRDTSFIT